MFEFVFGTLILAAGRSSRMGHPKLLLPWGSTSVLGQLIAQWGLAGAGQTAVVCAADDDRIRIELEKLMFPAKDRITNPNPERGMFSSILCGARWPGWKETLTHLTIVLGDQPHLRQATLSSLMSFASKHPGQVCQPAFKGRLAHPVVLPKFVFSELLNANAGTLKEFLTSFEVAAFPSDDPGLELDIDHPEDYERALALAGLSNSNRLAGR